MLIKCPRCSTTANLAGSQEGAKVRCGSCERVYVARPLGDRGKRTQSGVPPLAIVGGVVLAALLLILVLVKKSDSQDTQAHETTASVSQSAAQEEEPTDPYAYEGEVTQFCVRLHELSLELDRGALLSRLSGNHLLAAESEDLESSDRPFSTLGNLERRAHLDRWAEDLVTGASSEYIQNWKPYDSEVTQVNGKSAQVRLSVSSRSAGDASQKIVIWDLVRQDKRWKVAGWGLDQPKASTRTKAYGGLAQGTEKVELADGSVVRERQPENLPHLESTNSELAARIDKLFATLIDMDLTRESNQARAELTEIGKPSIPILLTGLFETRLDTEEDSIRANIIVVTLRNITGRNMGYQPMALAGGKNSEEYRMSAVRQWFAWWYLYGPKFKEKRQSEDALEEFIELSDKEKRALERDRKNNR